MKALKDEPPRLVPIGKTEQDGNPPSSSWKRGARLEKWRIMMIVRKDVKMAYALLLGAILHPEGRKENSTWPPPLFFLEMRSLLDKWRSVTINAPSFFKGEKGGRWPWHLHLSFWEMEVGLTPTLVKLVEGEPFHLPSAGKEWKRNVFLKDW